MYTSGLYEPFKIDHSDGANIARDIIIATAKVPNTRTFVTCFCNFVKSNELVFYFGAPTRYSLVGDQDFGIQLIITTYAAFGITTIIE